jgi:outer membrane protein OmpA-like peptidoglycan-associated protein
VIEYNYTVDNAKANGIVQVFDLSGNTVVQVRDLNPKATHFYDANNAPIQFKVVGQNVVLTGMHSSFTVSTAAAASRVVRKGGASMPAAAAPVPAASERLAANAEHSEAIAAEIGRIRKEIAELKVILAAAGNREPASTLAATAEVPSVAAEEASVVIVSFENNSRQFDPADEQKSQLAALSRSARTISVRGYTDSEFPTPGSTALARARAEAAKRYLISMGVTPKKIKLGYEPAGKFIADNGSTAGKAANRRVEIGGS